MSAISIPNKAMHYSYKSILKEVRSIQHCQYIINATEVHN